MNFTEGAHPIHIHEVQFQVVNRQPIGRGGPRRPERWESGYKDIVIAYPGEITRVKAKFDLPGLYVWHCHIVEHEDNEMMRPKSTSQRQSGVVNDSRCLAILGVRPRSSEERAEVS